MRDRWRLKGAFGAIEVLIHPEAQDAAARDESRRLARQLVYAFKYRDPEARRILHDVYARMHGVPAGALEGVDVDTGSPRAAAIAERILEASASGELQVRTLRTRELIVPLESVMEDVLGPLPEPTAWIEIELVDQDGEPVPDVEYRIECDDGRVRTGTTGLSGKAREEGLHDGNCKVSFPGLNAPDWSKVA